MTLTTHTAPLSLLLSLSLSSVNSSSYSSISRILLIRIARGLNSNAIIDIIINYYRKSINNS